MYRLTPKEEISARIKALKDRLARDGVDAVFLVQNADLFYFTGSIQQGVLIVPAGGDPVYFVRRVFERAVAEAAVEHIVRIASPKEIPAYFEKKKVAFGTIGFELDVMPVSTFQRFSRLFPEAKAVDASGAIREIRAVKAGSEIDAMRACGKNLSGLLSGARTEIRPGITETELGGILQGRAISGGHTTITRMRAWNQEVGLGCVISGADAALPSYADFPTAGKGSGPFVPVGQGHRPFRENEPILVDLMWAQDGYLVDMARTYVIGELPEKLQMAYEMTVKVMRNIESATRPGAVAGDLYEIGLEMASHSPFAANFMGAPGYNVKFIGHGVGIETDELPFIAKGAETVLAPGMTFALEPKFVFPSEGAVGVENTYLVTETGFEKLTLMEEGIIVCGARKEEVR
ncbi:MAG TPA: Xaa-Pro peptidase family protein [Candidatus Deferrimicrobiaceae bacterium]|nr:Xaa-Pro peptidase family protein [Candidatus Deferrimicrobiaceae bacterium]